MDGGRIAANEDVTIKAGEDVTIHSAKNTFESSSESLNVDARGGIGGSIGAGGASAGVTASASLGGSENDSEAMTNDNGEVTAGEVLTVESGKDTTIEGANLKGKEVVMKVGENLVVRSVQDTASAKGYNYNVGGSATVGMGVNVSANVGYGEHKSESKWVNEQTSIIGKEKVDIYTGKNTHVEGAIIAAENDNLVLNTETLTYNDIQDSDTSESFNTGVSVSVGFGGGDEGDGTEQEPGEGQGTGDDQPGENQQGESGTDQNGENKDAEQTKKDDSTIPGTASGDYSSKDKEQINRATIGKGTIIIRSDPDAGLEGLNRDLAKAQEITKDSETVVKVYVDPAAIVDIANGGKKLKEDVKKLAEETKKLSTKVSDIVADIKGKTELSPEEMQKLRREIFVALLDSKLLEKNGITGDVAEATVNQIASLYEDLRQSGVSNSKAIEIVENCFSNLGEWADKLDTKGLEITSSEGVSYIEVPGYDNLDIIPVVAGVDDAAAATIITIGLLATGATLYAIQQSNPEYAQELVAKMYTGLQKTIDSLPTEDESKEKLYEANVELVKMSTIYAELTGQKVAKSNGADGTQKEVALKSMNVLGANLEYDPITNRYYTEDSILYENGVPVVNEETGFQQLRVSLDDLKKYGGNIIDYPMEWGNKGWVESYPDGSELDKTPTVLIYVPVTPKKGDHIVIDPVGENLDLGPLINPVPESPGKGAYIVIAKGFEPPKIERDNDTPIGQGGENTGGSVKTWKKPGTKLRVEVENNPNNDGDGNIHFHDKQNKKYDYDLKRGEFKNHDTGKYIGHKKTQEIFNKYPGVKKGIEKAITNWLKEVIK